MLLLSLVVPFLVFATSVAGESQRPIPFTTIAVGSRSGIQTPTQVVARTSSEWSTLWRRHTAEQQSVPAPPPVNFSQDMVIGVFAGEVNENDRVAILSTFRHRNRLIVIVHIGGIQRGPAADGSKTATPFHIVRLPRMALPVVFRPAKSLDFPAPAP